MNHVLRPSLSQDTALSATLLGAETPLVSWDVDALRPTLAHTMGSPCLDVLRTYSGVRAESSARDRVAASQPLPPARPPPSERSDQPALPTKLKPSGSAPPRKGVTLRESAPPRKGLTLDDPAALAVDVAESLFLERPDSIRSVVK